MKNNTTVILGLLLPLTLALSSSCGQVTVGPDSQAVGAACTADAQCAQTCLVDERHFPGGLCTLHCATDADCPGGSVCLSDEGDGDGPVCVVSCATDADCAGFGRGFVCDRGEHQSGGGEASICRVP